MKALFEELNVEKLVVELDQREDGPQLHEALKAKVERTSVPQVFISGQHIGGCDDTVKAKEEGVLAKLLKSHNFDYDLIVIGGGSGGLAASKVSKDFIFIFINISSLNRKPLSITKRWRFSTTSYRHLWEPLGVSFNIDFSV